MMKLLYRIAVKLSRLWRGFWIEYAFPGKLKFLAANDPDPVLRRRALERLGVKIGKDAYINPGVRLVSDHPNEATLILGERVAIAPNVTFVCNSGPCSSRLRTECAYVKDRLVKRATISVGDDAWLGAGAILLPGVTVGARCVIGAGAVVVNDCPPNTIWAGVPARQIRELS